MIQGVNTVKGLVACLAVSFEVRDCDLANATANQAHHLVEAAIVAFIRNATTM